MSAQLLEQNVRVCIGHTGLDVGELTFVRDGRREYSAFAYTQSWLQQAQGAEVLIRSDSC